MLDYYGSRNSKSRPVQARGEEYVKPLSTVLACIVGGAFVGAFAPGAAAQSAPTITSVAFDHEPYEPSTVDTFEYGAVISAVVKFDRKIGFSYSPRLAFEIGQTTRYMDWWFDSYEDEDGQEVSHVSFAYAVQEDDLDTDGISIPDNAIDLNGGSIHLDGQPEIQADLRSPGVAADPTRKVDGRVVSAPRIDAIWADDFDAALAGFETPYGVGQGFHVTVRFEKAVVLTGEPEVEIQVGENLRRARLDEPWGFADKTMQFAFRYDVQPGDLDADGISIPVNPVRLNGGSFTLVDHPAVAADLSHEQPLDFPEFTVDATATPAPRIRTIPMESHPEGEAYGTGEYVEVTALFDRGVDITGTPELSLRIGEDTKRATFQANGWRGWFDTQAQFRYQVEEGDLDLDGIGIPADAVDLNGGAVSLVGHPDVAADLSNAALPDDSGHKVDAQPPPPVSVGFGELPTRNDTYEFGEVIYPYVEFDQRVQVHFGGGLPQVALRIGDATRQASYWYLDNPEDAGTRIWFTYVVQADDRDADGLGVPASALSLDGGSITLASDSSVEVDVDHDAIADDPSRKVDGAVESAPRIRWLFYPFDTNMPQAGDTYGLGDSISVSVEWDRAVEYSGSPRLALTIGGQTRYASDSYRSGANAKITFRYVVEASDMDDDGVSIAANALSLNGGSITLQERPAIAASLTHDALEDDPERKVDGSIVPTVPTVATIAFGGGPASGDTYTLGETIEAVVAFDSLVTLDHRVRLAIEVGSETRPAALSRSQSNRGTFFTFEYLVQAADVDADGISIAADALTLNGATATVDLSHEAVAADPNRRVDGSVAVAPKIASVAIYGRPQRAGDGRGFPVYGDTYELGEAILIGVDFDKPVRPTGALQVALDIGGRTRQASSSTHSLGRTIWVDYLVQSEDVDLDGITIPANAVTLNGGTIVMQGDASIAADLAHDAVVGEHKVDGSAVSQPRILWGAFGISATTAAADLESYRRGETIGVRVFLDRRVDVAGEPQLALEIGTRTRQASFRELLADGKITLLFFDYVVQSEDVDSDGIGIPASAISLNGGTITLKGTSTAADLAHGSTAIRGNVDGSTVAAPAVTGVLVDWQPASGGSYGLGEPIHARACFSGGVSVSGSPEMTIEVGAQRRQATYMATPNAACAWFSYSVQAGDVDEDGISIPANSLGQSGGSIVLAGDGAVAADPAHDAAGPTDGLDRRVDGSHVVAPRVTSVSFRGYPVRGSTYGAGEKIGVRLAFDKLLTVSGEPRLQLTIGARTRQATFAGQELSDSLHYDDTFLLLFEYTVQPGDMDADGISIAADSLSLNGGSLTLMGSPGAAADLSHSAVNPDETRLVDAPDTGPVFSTAIAGQVWVVNEAVSLELPEAVGDGELTYSLSPVLPAGLTFDADTRLLSGTPMSAAGLMAFEYTVTDGDAEDPESATLRFSVTVIPESQMAVGGESTGDDAVEVNWRGQWTDASRGRLAIEARSPTTEWTVVGMVDPSSGDFIVRGLEPETPYTFRLRFESPDRAAARSASTQTSSEYSEEFSVTTGSYTGPCRSGGKYLCLRDGRFELRAHWTNPDRAGDFGFGTAVPVDISDESGLFWFFEPANVELVAKVLDGSRLNGYYWMFFGALSDVEYWLTLRDTAVGGSQRTYHNPPKEICGQSDVRALPGDVAALLGLSSSSMEASSGPGQPDVVRLAAAPLPSTGLDQRSESAGACESSAERLCLLENRFSVEVRFIDPNIADPAADPEGAAVVLPSLTTENTGFFWFFNQENVELAVKALDGRAINGKFWLLYGALSDVEYEITVTDTATGESKTYRNEAGSVCGEIDTGAF